MRNWIAGLVATFMPYALAFAAQMEEGAAATEPAETASMGVVIGFGVLFVVLIVWFFLKVWRDEKKGGAEE